MIIAEAGSTTADAARASAWILERCRRGRFFTNGPDSHHAAPMRHLFPREIGRVNYLLRWIILAGAAFGLLVAAKRIDGFDVPATILVCTLFVLRFPCLEIPRIRNIGWSPWVLLLLFVPVINVFLQLCLAFGPTDKKDAEPT